MGMKSTTAIIIVKATKFSEPWSIWTETSKQMILSSWHVSQLVATCSIIHLKDHPKSSMNPHKSYFFPIAQAFSFSNFKYKLGLPPTQ